MKYEVLMSYKPLKFQVVEELEKIGIVVPYDSSTPEINTFAYRPEDLDIDVNDVCESYELSAYGVFITQEEFDKHLNKIESLNKVDKDDTVFFKDFKNLPLLIESIDGDEAYCRIRLRSFSKCVKLPLKALHKDPSITPLPMGDIVITPNIGKIYLDMDYVEDSESPDYCYNLIFTTVLQVKTMYGKRDVVLLNPSESFKEFAEDFGIEVIQGDLISILIGEDVNTSSGDMVVTNNLYSLYVCDKILTFNHKRRAYMEYHRGYHFNRLGITDLNHFYSFMEARDEDRRGYFSSPGDFSSIVEATLGLIPVINKSPYEKVILKKNVSDIVRIKKSFMRHNIMFYVYNIEYYFRIIKN